MGCWLLALPRAQMTRLSRILGVWFTYYVPVLINFMTPSKHLSIAYQGINLRRLLRFFFLSKAPHAVSRKIRENRVRKKEGNIALGQSAREKSLSYCKTFLPHPLLCESSKLVPRFLYWGCQSKECVTGHVLVAYVYTEASLLVSKLRVLYSSSVKTKPW